VTESRKSGQEANLTLTIAAVETILRASRRHCITLSDSGPKPKAKHAGFAVEKATLSTPKPAIGIA